MKTPSEVVEFLERIIRSATLRPRMYAPSPECLELVLMAYDSIRAFALSDGAKSYADFLMANDQYQADLFVSVISRQNPTMSDEEKFHRLTEFWRQYVCTWEKT